MIKLLARLYLLIPEWMVKLLPKRINYAEEGRFNEAVLEAYDEMIKRERRKNR